jgi:UDP-glucose 4-epimerase
MNEILVTGGAGFIGTHACIALLQAGYSVVILDNLCNARQESVLHLEQITGASIPFYQMDVRNADGLRQLFQTHQFSAVLHFAGRKAVGESLEQPLQYYQNNVGGIMQLLQVMQETTCRTLIFSSSATVYGTQHTAPYVETMVPLSANNPYGETKIICEQLLQSVCNADPSWHITALRYFNPIGAHESGLLGEQPNGIPSNIVPYLALVASGQLPCLRVYGNDYDTPDGTGIRDYIHVMDLAEGHVAALQYSFQHNGYSVFNLGTGTAHSVLELVQTYAAVSQRPIPISISPRRNGDVAVSYADATKAKTILGWTAKRNLEQMCLDSWRFAQKQKGASL